ncbi:hypothetical protein BBK82_46280 [Lentzea guizhouensis]|uniref:Ricin B lectin domain-containing protein n=2 Tax=Lentzea guizhouensis TaxID=1586287 RepID=A0A1B2HWY3_9PSEU|nr:hypothetical protein BBK82_46280 [Lentzea guizhouensis]
MTRRFVGTGAAVAAAATLLLGAASGTATATTGQQEAAGINIKHASVRTCLDSNAAGAVYTHNCNGNDYQEWENYTPGKFRNKATQRCLGSNGNSVFTTANCAAGSTNWTTTSGSPKHIKHATTGVCLHNAGGHGSAVGLAACGSATRWSTLAAG